MTLLLSIAFLYNPAASLTGHPPHSVLALKGEEGTGRNAARSGHASESPSLDLTSRRSYRRSEEGAESFAIQSSEVAAARMDVRARTQQASATGGSPRGPVITKVAGGEFLQARNGNQAPSAISEVLFQPSKQGVTGRQSEIDGLMTLSRKRSHLSANTSSIAIAFGCSNDALGLRPSECTREGFCGEPKGDDPRWNRQSARPALNVGGSKRPIKAAGSLPSRRPDTANDQASHPRSDASSFQPRRSRGPVSIGLRLITSVKRVRLAPVASISEPFAIGCGPLRSASGDASSLTLTPSSQPIVEGFFGGVA